MKVILKLVFLFSFLVILFGFYQLKHEQDIFAQSKKACCNNEQCSYVGNIPCTFSSSIDLKSDDCKPNSYNFTCRDCVDYSAAGQVCDDPKSSCVDGGGNCYGWCYKNGTWQWVIAK